MIPLKGVARNSSTLAKPVCLAAASFA